MPRPTVTPVGEENPKLLSGWDNDVRHGVTMPPSTMRTWPVMKLEASLPR
jgi:hypothetical protein